MLTVFPTWLCLVCQLIPALPWLVDCVQVKAPKDSMDEKGFFKRLEAAADDAATDDGGDGRKLL